MAEFSAKPRSRPFFGGEVSFPFTARMQSADMAVQNHNGEVVGRALIPGWLLAAVLLLIVAIACLSVGLILWGGAPEGAPTEPPVVQPTDEGDQPVPTEPPPELPTEASPEQPTEPLPEEPPTEPPPQQPTEEPTE